MAKLLPNKYPGFERRDAEDFDEWGLVGEDA